MCPNTYWPHAWATATVRYAKRLMKIEVRHIGTKFSRPRQADQCVKIGTVDINLPAVLMNEAA